MEQLLLIYEYVLAVWGQASLVDKSAFCVLWLAIFVFGFLGD